MSTVNLGQTPTLEQLVAQARNAGWAFFDGPGNPDPRGMGKPDDRMQRMAALAAALYEAPEFRELLGFLAEQTLHRQTFVSPLVGVDPMQGYCFGVFREGQNSMVFSIFKLIAQGRDQTIERREQ